MKTIIAIIKSRRDSEEQWTINNPVLNEGEQAITNSGINKGRKKIGDGVTTWTDLEYADKKIFDIAEKIDGDLTAHKNNKNNPHTVTKSQVGLGDVDNTSDANKPVSIATQIALNAESADRHSADESLKQAILAEADTRQQQIGEAINNEAQTRAQADDVLQTNIDKEAQTRAQADDVLQTNIDKEAQTRAQGDNALYDLINFLIDLIENKIGSFAGIPLITDNGDYLITENGDYIITG